MEQISRNLKMSKYYVHIDSMNNIHQLHMLILSVMHTITIYYNIIISFWFIVVKPPCNSGETVLLVFLFVWSINSTLNYNDEYFWSRKPEIRWARPLLLILFHVILLSVTQHIQTEREDERPSNVEADERCRHGQTLSVLTGISKLFCWLPLQRRRLWLQRLQVTPFGGARCVLLSRDTIGKTPWGHVKEQLNLKYIYIFANPYWCFSNHAELQKFPS